MAEQEQDGRQIGIQKIYVKDFSFESPRTPGVFKKTDLLHGGDGYAVETVVNENEVHKLILSLRAAGAAGFIEYPLNKVIP